ATTPEMPDASVGIVVHAARDVRVEPVPLRPPAGDGAIVQIKYGGLCGSALHYWTHGAAGESILRAPMLLGHEVVGVVVRPAADGSGFSAGARVAVPPASPAGDGVSPSSSERPTF